MSSLQSLIRLHRFQLDERRRQLADLDQLATKLRQERQRLDVEQQVEQTVAAQSIEAAQTYGTYARSLIERRRRLDQSLAEVEQQIAQAREALAEAFQEVKRYEITADNRERQQRQKLARRQQALMDELGLDRHARRKAQEG